MGRLSRQRVCGERNGRTVFAPTHICADIAGLNKQPRRATRGRPYMKCETHEALGDYFSVLNGASGMPVSLKIVTSQ